LDNNFIYCSFDTMKIVTAICRILNHFVKNWVGAYHTDSEATVNTYCQILFLWVKLRDEDPEIPKLLEQQVVDMLQSDQHRHKNYISDIGVFLVMLAWSKYGLRDPDINEILLEEYSARQVFWVMKDNPSENDKTEIIKRSSCRAEKYFHSKSCLISHQLFAFNVEVIRIFNNPEMLKKLELNYGFPDDKTMKIFRERFYWVKHNVVNFKAFFECIGMSERINADDENVMHQYLDRAFRISHSQKYTPILYLDTVHTVL